MKRVATVSGALIVCLAAGCAVFERDNRRALNALDDHLAPSGTAAKVALAPVALVAGTVALAADTAVVHPAAVVGDAWGDTADLLWSSRDETPFRRAVLAPLAALGTPVVFAGDWLGRALLAIPPRPAGDDEAAPEDDR